MPIPLTLSLGDWLGLVGITITIIQITRAGRAIRQTKRAVENASLTSSVYNVLALAPRMSVIETQLEFTARGNDVDGFLAALRSYKELAAELDGLLHQEPKHSRDARLKIQKSLTQASTTKLPATSAPLDLQAKTNNLRRAVGDASVEVTRMTARLRSDLVPPEAPKKRLIDRIRGAGA